MYDRLGAACKHDIEAAGTGDSTSMGRVQRSTGRRKEGISCKAHTLCTWACTYSTVCLSSEATHQPSTRSPRQSWPSVIVIVAPTTTRPSSPSLVAWGHPSTHPSIHPSGTTCLNVTHPSRRSSKDPRPPGSRRTRPQPKARPSRTSPGPAIVRTSEGPSFFARTDGQR